MTTEPYPRPRIDVSPRGSSICPRCNLPCETMERETKAGTVDVSTCCVANLTNEELASVGLQRIKPRIQVTPAKREAEA